MIGYYVHHVGRGHLHRALTLARAMDVPVTGLSSLPRPEGWPGAWVHLDRDDDGDTGTDPTARGRLHWVPQGHPGLRARMAELSAWISHVQPALMIVDCSVEVALLARLHGVPVLSVVLPGRRDDDPHRLGFEVADALVGFWPAEADGMLVHVPEAVRRRVHAVGALSRFSAAPDDPAPGRRGAGTEGERSVLLLVGAGGTSWTTDLVEQARRQTPGWSWQVAGLGQWVEDPEQSLAAADVVVTHAGQNALAEVAALRRPAVVVPEDRPHDEQRVSAQALATLGLPVVVEPRVPTDGWAARLERAAALPGEEWARWCDGWAISRFVDVVRTTAKLDR